MKLSQSADGSADFPSVTHLQPGCTTSLWPSACFVAAALPADVVHDDLCVFFIKIIKKIKIIFDKVKIYVN